MHRQLSMAALLFSVAMCRAEVIEVTADWLNDHVLVVQAGDQATIIGTATQQNVRLENLVWTGGSLTLTSCRLAPSGNDRGITGLPFVVQAGQSLSLTQTWIVDADTAIVANGGSVTLTEVTLASTGANLRSIHPSSTLALNQVNLCNADTGLELAACQSATIQNALFLTNTTAMRIIGPAPVMVSDALFQGNEWGIRISADAQPPVLGYGVDLVDSRYALIENLSSTNIDLGDSFVDELSMIQGGWFRSGINPDYPVHPLKTAQPPVVIIDDDDIVYTLSIIFPTLTTDNIPISISAISVYESSSPYDEYNLVKKVLLNELSFQLTINTSMFYKVGACIGEWDYFDE